MGLTQSRTGGGTAEGAVLGSHGSGIHPGVACGDALVAGNVGFAVQTVNAIGVTGLGAGSFGAGHILGVGVGALGIHNGRCFHLGNCIELAVETIIGSSVGTNGGIVLIISGAEPVRLIIYLCNDGLMLSIPGINGRCSGLISAIDMGAADNHVDVGLGSTGHRVEVVATGGIFQIDINGCIYIGSSSKVICLCHAASQIVDIGSRHIALNHTELINSAGNGSVDQCDGGFGSRIGIGSRSGGLAGALGASGVELADETIVGSLVRTNSGIFLVISGAEPVGFTLDSCNNGLIGCIPCVDGGRGGFISTVNMFTTNDHVDVLLGAAIHGIEIVAAGGFFQIDIDGCICIGGGSKIIGLCHTASQIVDIRSGNIALNHAELIGSAGSHSVHRSSTGSRSCRHSGAATDTVTDAVLRVLVDVTQSGNLVALVAVATAFHRAGVDGVTHGGAGSCNGSACYKIVAIVVAGVRTLTGGSGVIGGNLCTQQQEAQFGVVNENVTGAGDGLDRVVTTHFPSVNGVLFHPLQQDFLVLNNAIGAPHLRCILPADIAVQHHTGHVATDIITGGSHVLIGIVIAAAFAISFVATAAVDSGRGRTQQHDVRCVTNGAVVGSGDLHLALRPAVLTVVGDALIPFTAELVAGVEAGDIITVALLAVSERKQITNIAIAGVSRHVFGQELLDLFVHFRGRNIFARNAFNCKLGKCVICIVPCVEGFCIGGKGCGSLAALTPVFDNIRIAAIAAILIGGGGCAAGKLQCGQQADAHDQRHEQCQAAFYGLVHNT